MSNMLGDPYLLDLSDVSYEITKWILEYQFVDKQKICVRDDILEFFNDINRLSSPQKGFD